MASSGSQQSIRQATARSAQSPRPTLLVFADDWGRHPSSCQHLIGRLVTKYDVLWVNTIGTRSPKLNVATLKRGIEKIVDWFGGSKCQSANPAGLKVVNPWMLPSFKTPLARRVNRYLLTKQLAKAIDAASCPVVAISTLPITSDLVGALRVSRWTYYCVDDFGEWPGLDRDVLHSMEERLVECVDEIIVVSETLQNRIAQMGRRSILITHGVDSNHWCEQHSGFSDEIQSRLRSLPHPIVAFWGVIDPRMDVNFLAKLCSDLTDGTVLLVGPDDNSPVRDLPRLVQWGPLPYEALPAVACESSVLVMPYADLPVTRAMQPLKLKEYMSTGKPVVVRDLPACREWSDCLDIVDTPEAFSRIVRSRIADGLPKVQALARRRLESESWEAKSKQFEQIVLGFRDVLSSAAGNEVLHSVPTMPL